MTIQIPPNHPLLGNGSTLPGAGDMPKVHIHHTGAGAPASLDPAAWRDVPPDLSTNTKSHSHSPAEGRFPLPPPPAGDTDPATHVRLNDKFGQFLGLGAGGGNENGQNDGAEDGGGDGGGGGTKPPTHHFDFDDVLMLLVTESADGFKMAASQTQLATTEKIESLTDEISQIEDSAADRKFAGILGGTATMAAGATQVVGAGINLKGVAAASKEIESTAADMAENAQGTLDAVSKAQMFNRLTAGPAAWAQLSGGVGALTQGSLNVGQAMKESSASKHDAAKAADDKAVAADDALHDNAQSMKQQALQVMQDFIERGKNLEQSRDQTMKAIAHI